MSKFSLPKDEEPKVDAARDDALRAGLLVVADLPAQVYHAGRAALGLEERSLDSVIGVVGVGRISGEIASADVEGYTLGARLADMLMLLGGLNLALFVFNMIPLVPLDGGHIASALWQGIKNGWARVRGLAAPRPVDVARMMPVAYGVFAVLLLWGAWAIRTAYVGWAENQLNQRQFLGVVVRFLAMYLVLTFFLLS